MFGIGFQEMLIILVVVLIFFGPKRLPDLAKSLGKGIAEFKKASEEVRKGIEDVVKEESAEGTTKPPEDLSSYGKAPGSPPPTSTGPAMPNTLPPGMVLTSTSDAPTQEPSAGPAPPTGASPAAGGAAVETAAGETPATPPRQG
jgi:TatA/E family protein of Tat protein translocase